MTDNWPHQQTNYSNPTLNMPITCSSSTTALKTRQKHNYGRLQIKAFTPHLQTEPVLTAWELHMMNK
jgi:hypothetical protein